MLNARVLLECESCPDLPKSIDAVSPAPYPSSFCACSYVGVMHMEFIQYLCGLGVPVSPNLTTGNGMDFLVGRVSYTFGLQGIVLHVVEVERRSDRMAETPASCAAGPCLSTHTACSSSLVATHLAHTGLLNREAESAASCGVFMVLLPDTMSGICQLQALSPVGRCKTFDSSGDGYGRGEGCAVVIMRPTGSGNGEALALVCSTVVNQDGRSSSLTAPNGPSQTILVSAALQNIGMIEIGESNTCSHLNALQSPFL